MYPSLLPSLSLTRLRRNSNPNSNLQHNPNPNPNWVGVLAIASRCHDLLTYDICAHCPGLSKTPSPSNTTALEQDADRLTGPAKREQIPQRPERAKPSREDGSSDPQGFVEAPVGGQHGWRRRRLCQVFKARALSPLFVLRPTPFSRAYPPVLGLGLILILKLISDVCF